MPNILFVTSEAHPLIKTGGLGDVCGSLPVALQRLGNDVRVLLPAYGVAKQRTHDAKTVARLDRHGAPDDVTLLETTLPGTQVKAWLVDCPALFDRPGNPYMTPDGQAWPDNAQRFALLCRTAFDVALNRAGMAWRPDVVHCNDWQTGLLPALLAGEAQRPATVFTIHNLAYQGLFPAATFQALDLPASLWSPTALEFYNQLCFIKGGLAFADAITTVSPNYAREIQTAEFGCGLDGLLRMRSNVLHGIINGIDHHEWDPAHDTAIAQCFDVASFEKKMTNKHALQREFGLPVTNDVALVGTVGRLVHQKGVDLLIDALPQLVSQPIQLVVLGSGEAQYAHQLENWARRLPQLIGVRIGYDEGLAHRIEAGSDAFLMPSRFEPCGLNQLYSLRYGTVPIVRHVGGLADTVVDTNDQTLANGTATGFVIEREDVAALAAAVNRAQRLFHDQVAWRKIATTGMRQDHSWDSSARSYLAVYDTAAQALNLRR